MEDNKDSLSFRIRESFKRRWMLAYFLSELVFLLFVTLNLNVAFLEVNEVRFLKVRLIYSKGSQDTGTTPLIF